MDWERDEGERDFSLDVYWILALAATLAGLIVYRALTWTLPAA